MKNLKNICVIALLLCMMLSLCACGGNENAAEPAETEAAAAETTEAAAETEATLAEGMVIYTVTVVDEGGNPVVGAMVQLCKDSCVPGVTDEAGVATFTLAEDEYKASMLAMPEGYEYVDETTEFYFDGGSSVTIILKAAA